MKKIVYTMFLSASLLFGIEWQKDLDTAFKLANKTDRHMMIMVESTHCKWCVKMKDITLQDKEVIVKLDSYIKVKVMRDDVNVSKLLPNIEAVPMMFFMDKNKNIIDTVVGYFDARDFIFYLNHIEDKMSKKSKEEPK